MGNKEIIASAVLLIIGLLFLLNSKNMSKGTFKLYRIIYTKKNLNIMFKAAGITLILGAILLQVLR